MQIQPPINVGIGQGPQGVSFPNSSGGTSPGAGEGVRADWNVRMNVRHGSGFVGGAGRMLVHNQTTEERREIVLFLPAAMADRPGRLELASAVVCSAKPGLQAAPGQTLVYRMEGPKAIVTVPLLKMNDWVYVDLTWTGAFPQGGMAFPGGQVPLGEFHPQLAVEVAREDGRVALGPVPARYEVELHSDPGAVVRLEHEEHGRPLSRASEGGDVTIHEFKSYGKAHIQALLAPPGAIAGPGSSQQPQRAQQPAGNVPALDATAPRFVR
jgi:hypothetical protein